MRKRHGVVILNRKEGKEMFDREVWRTFKISGDEFIRKYKSGEFDYEDCDVVRLSFLLPFAGVAMSHPEKLVGAEKVSQQIAEQRKWVQWEPVANHLVEIQQRWMERVELLEQLYGEGCPVARAVRTCIDELYSPIDKLRSGDGYHYE